MSAKVLSLTVMPKISPRVIDNSDATNQTSNDRENTKPDIGERHSGCNTNPQNSFQHYTERTSVHGLHYIGSSNVHTLRRFVYAILVTGATGWLLSILYYSGIKYTSFAVSTTISLQYPPEVTFPAVTVCNYNSYRRSYINGTKFAEWQVKLNDPVQQKRGGEPDVDWTSEAALHELSKNRTEFELSAAQPKTMMIKDCILGQVRGNCNAEQNFTTTFTDFGVCYSYNYLIGNNQADVVKVQHSGSRHGFQMSLYLNEEEYSPGGHLGAGFKILVHRPDEVPLITDYGIAVSPGTETFLSTSMIVEKNQQAPYDTKCQDLVLKYYPTYTKSNCIMERITDMVTSTCNCKELYMEGPFRICNYREKVECADKVIAGVGNSSSSPDSCPVACDIIYFETNPSYAKFPGPQTLQYLQVMYNSSVQSLRDNVVHIHIYFRELSYMYIEQFPAYDGMSFLGDFGGQMGLCLGASLLSAYELVEFIGMLIFKIFKR